MDILRGTFGGIDGVADAGFDLDRHDDEAIDDSLPPQIGADERRMQVRAYNFWAGLLDNRNFPSVEDLDPTLLPDFGPHGVLLDFSQGIDDPVITFIGSRLAEECALGDRDIRRLSDVPSRSLLSRITDHYMQILANQAPIGFEAEFVNQREATIAYRGILLPFSSDDQTIDFIFGVINWKEIADARVADELLLEIDQAIDHGKEAEPARYRGDDLPMADWADGPGAIDPLPVPSFAFPVADESPQSLADWLAAAREQAQEARSSEDRTRSALYEAIGRAHDFALAAAEQPDAFAELVEDAGLTVQDRAPMTPVVKLVFGADYDKTRLTEYAAALTHAKFLGLGRGELAAYLRSAPGGLKGVVAEERRRRRNEDGAGAPDPRSQMLARLRALEPTGLGAIPATGEEFALVMVRRTESGELAVLGEVPADPALVERAARRMVG